eukprot:g31389.t1
MAHARLAFMSDMTHAAPPRAFLADEWCRKDLDASTAELFAKIQIDPNPASLSPSDIQRSLKEYGVTEYNNDALFMSKLLQQIEIFLPLVGVWEHRKFGRSYKIALNKSGKLLWQGSHITGEPLLGVLTPEGMWICSELLTPKEEKIGSVRLRHGPEWDQLSLNFKTNSVTQWGADVCATRVTAEIRICRPPFPSMESKPSFAEAQPGLVPIKAVSSIAAAAELSTLSLLQLKEPTISSNCLDEPQKQFPLDLVLSSVYGQGSIRLRHGPKWNEVMSNFRSHMMTEWGSDIIAERVGEEEPLRRPSFDEETEEEEDVVLTDISELSAQEPLPAVRDFEDDDELVESQYWESLEVLSQALRVEHAALVPLERRAKSWARSVAFAQMTLGMRGIPMKGADGVRWSAGFEVRCGVGPV